MRKKAFEFVLENQLLLENKICSVDQVFRITITYQPKLLINFTLCIAVMKSLKKMMLLLLLFILCQGLCLEAFILEGSQTSYAQFKKWYTSGNATIEFEFLTSLPNGLLLYTDDGGYYDFLEVKLVDGSLRTRLNLGNGAQIVDLGRELNDGYSWHKVSFFYNLYAHKHPFTFKSPFSIKFF